MTTLTSFLLLSTILFSTPLVFGDAPSEGLPPLTDYSSWCTDDTNTYKSFSAWENVIQQLGLE